MLADILGFKEQTRAAFASGIAESDLQSLYKILSKEYSGLDDPSNSKWRLKVFSDNLLLGYPFLAEQSGLFEFQQACFTMAHYQIGMASHGYFIRGGIGVGDVHVGNLIVYGEVLAEIAAADKPNTPPRIVLLESATAHLAKITPLPYLDRILSNVEGTSYISYLDILDLSDDPSRQRLVLQHKAIIKERLDQFGDKESHRPTLEKYRWLADYHNDFCRRSEHFRNLQFLI